MRYRQKLFSFFERRDTAIPEAEAAIEPVFTWTNEEDRMLKLWMLKVFAECEIKEGTLVDNHARLEVQVGYHPKFKRAEDPAADTYTTLEDDYVIYDGFAYSMSLATTDIRIEDVLSEVITFPQALDFRVNDDLYVNLYRWYPVDYSSLWNFLRVIFYYT